MVALTRDGRGGACGAVQRQGGTCTFRTRARCPCLAHSFSLRMQRPSFSNSLAPTERVSVWQFGLVRRFDSVELYGRPRSRKCDRRAVDPSTGSTAAGLRGLESIVAVFGCTLAFGLPLLGQWLRPVFQAFWHHQELLNILRFSISFLVLLLPTTAMGLTLPVLLEDPLLYRRQFGRVIAVFYGFNTLGGRCRGRCGRSLSDSRFGLPGTGLIAACLSLAAAGIAWLFAGTAPARTEATGLQFSLSKKKPWKLLLVSLGTGVLFLSLEVIWFRFMRLYVASSSTAFCTMLAVVLVGIGLGGLTASAIRTATSRKILPLLLLLAAIGALLSYVFFPGRFKAMAKPSTSSPGRRSRDSRSL